MNQKQSEMAFNFYCFKPFYAFLRDFEIFYPYFVTLNK